MEEDNKRHITYIIEHFEQEVSKWTYCEYTHMILILSNLYNDSSADSTLVITNFSFPTEFRSGKLQEDEFGSKKNVEAFLKINENLGKKCLTSKYSLLELTTKDKIDQIMASDHHKFDDTEDILKLLSDRIKSTQENLCFMDMRGEKTLQPDDQFELLIFGGILGDHPPKDRSKDFRSNFSNVRSLGPVQMTTDTALLVSREIIEEGKKFTELKFIDEPQIPTDDNVERYLDVRLPLDTLVSDMYKFSQSKDSVRKFRVEAVEKEGDIFEFEKYEKMKKSENEDADKEEFTIMEGFKYRLNDTVFPVYKGNKKLDDFPIIPIGMLDIWRSENDFDF